ncbi:hypothetical protein O6H91_15G007200 [Diphasiastrum complanatum]|uniref:Uncharacterized protein n=7 Tax=Diphasiastrum complanatum TaxID=34168 RepID=A0ACC2BFQ4_DIPCM|nr:hypothetical protein O6H91_15G007200 [Diphasiastrum complanatum]KAJ7528528.1 hypothetical protein O6H91_15G007200 [Diphasiastrum complanatum]KAJ7528530.1 hypothetical protein O6H91_15G007200 [Diphasiastrum complanatum]KAJ7528531.1 hypothetical protein O6H91_15G007200 [Diphasiastrum complanatum]KAJ7528535.1 hypothetical protein O6H91_15G007200 [Diphasiastrum complanatum]
MAFGRNLRHDKRLPSRYLTGTICVFVAFFLIAVWVLRSPSEFPREADNDLATANVPSKNSPPSTLAKNAEDAVEDADVEKDSAVTKDGQESSEKKTDTLEDDKGEEGDLERTKNGQEPSEEKDDSERLKFDNSDDNAEGKNIDQEIEKDHTNKDAEAEQIKNQQEQSSEEKYGSDDKNKNQQDSSSEKSSEESKSDVFETLPSVAQSELTTENNESSATWITQATESRDEQRLNNTKDNEDQQPIEESNKSDEQRLNNTKDNEDQQPIEDSNKSEDVMQHETEDSPKSDSNDLEKTTREGTVENSVQYKWKLCKWNGAVDYIPCLENKKAIKSLKSKKHFEHRERHCPTEEELTTCLVPLPDGYKLPIRWPKSRDEIWFNNVPHPKLVSYKQDQNWMTRSEDRLLFPGGGTQFKDGALFYINYTEEVLPDISWGKHTRVVLDIGCGVASFGGYLFDKDVLTMSFAPNDEHEAQVQLALERGIPAFLSVMGTQRLVFPSNVYDVAHCARCRVHWHTEGARLLLEINRVLRPGGYFVWSATPVYRTEREEVYVWREVETAASGMCWKLVVKTTNIQTGVGVAIFQKPKDNRCFEERTKNEPPFCEKDDNPDAAWYVRMRSCLHKIPDSNSIHGIEWPRDWPMRLEEPPTWLSAVPKGLYGKQAAAEFQSDNEHWKHIIEKSYLRGLGIKWEEIRNVLDMKAGYGGFAAALAGLPIWVMNVIPVDEPDTLPIIFDRGLIGLYHDWCESFSTYPRTYDLLHVDHLFLKLSRRCSIMKTLVEIDRILRPEGWIIFRDRTEIFDQIEPIAKSLHWDIHVSYKQEHEQLLVAQKTMWRPSK